MRIALVSPVERSTLDLANQLTRMGHEAIVVVPSDESRSYAQDGAWVRTVPIERLVDVLREERSDILHVMHPPDVPQALEAAARLDLPVVAHVADFDAQPLLARAAVVVSPSRRTIERYADAGFDTTAWHHIPWGADYAGFEGRTDPPPGDELVLGALDDDEGFVEQALQLLPGRPIRLLRFGDSREDESSIFAKLSAAVIPSTSSPTALDAVAAGVPLIAPDADGSKELIDDYDCGFTYAAGDPEALATLLGELCDNRAPLDDVRRRTALPPSIEETAWRLEGIYAECRGVGVPW